ncbi:MAG TPA: hypothetical protein PL033_12055 [Candidatus Brocadiia bacterium]|nr:hypothetical protein [Candidatus Brocadiia bacterium]
MIFAHTADWQMGMKALSAGDKAGEVRKERIEAADRLQILILTCHPERYAGLSDVERFNLEEILSKS